VVVAATDADALVVVLLAVAAPAAAVGIAAVGVVARSRGPVHAAATRASAAVAAPIGAVRRRVIGLGWPTGTYRGCRPLRGGHATSGALREGSRIAVR